MPNSKKNRDVIIVGAGPVGLCLAKKLGQEGIKTLLLEKEESLSIQSKAITVWPVTQSILKNIGLLKTFEQESMAFDNLVLHDADTNKKLLKLPLKELADQTPHPQLLIIPQNKTEKLLRDSINSENNVELLLGAEAIAFEDLEKEVEVTYTQNREKHNTKARFLIGCDGAHSFVREELKLELEGKTFPFKAGLADVKLKSEKKYDFPRISNKNNTCIGFHIEDHIWRIIFIRRRDEDINVSDAIDQTMTQLFENESYETIWESNFNLHTRIATHFTVGNITLAGDAAHLNSPVGGQGMNAGIVDTKLLTLKISEALKTDSNSPLLEYAKIRREAINKGVNKNTGFITSLLLFKKGKFIKVFIRLINLLLKIQPIRHRFLMGVTMLSNNHHINKTDKSK